MEKSRRIYKAKKRMTVMCLLLLVMICVGLTGGAVKIGLQELYEGAPFFIWLLVGRRKRGRNDQG